LLIVKCNPSFRPTGCSLFKQEVSCGVQACSGRIAPAFRRRHGRSSLGV
jgi:hypothetical protein